MDVTDCVHVEVLGSIHGMMGVSSFVTSYMEKLFTKTRALASVGDRGIPHHFRQIPPPNFLGRGGLFTGHIFQMSPLK